MFVGVYNFGVILVERVVKTEQAKARDHWMNVVKRMQLRLILKL